MNPSHSKLKYGVIIFLLLSAALLFFVWRNEKIKNDELTAEELMREQIRKELSTPTPELSEKDTTKIRAELSKPPNVPTDEGVVKNKDGTVELSEEEKARIRKELQN